MAVVYSTNKRRRSLISEIQLLPSWQKYIPSWSAPLGQVRSKSYFGVNSVLYHSSLFSLSLLLLLWLPCHFFAALSHRLAFLFSCLVFSLEIVMFVPFPDFIIQSSTERLKTCNEECSAIVMDGRKRVSQRFKNLHQFQQQSTACFHEHLTVMRSGYRKL